MLKINRSFPNSCYLGDIISNNVYMCACWGLPVISTIHNLWSDFYQWNAVQILLTNSHYFHWQNRKKYSSGGETEIQAGGRVLLPRCHAAGERDGSSASDPWKDGNRAGRGTRGGAAYGQPTCLTTFTSVALLPPSWWFGRRCRNQSALGSIFVAFTCVCRIYSVCA